MRRTTRVLALFAVIGLTLGLVAACGGGGGSKKFNEADAQAQVKANWEAFFDNKTTEDNRVALIQGGEALRAAIQAAQKNPLASQAKTSVTKVVIDPGHTTATVTYNIAVNGNNVVTGGTGQAVLEGDKWKVSKTAFCGLIQAGSTSPVPGCS